VRLGVYADLVYRRDDDGLSADRAFVNFVASLPPRVDELVLFGRLDPLPGRHPYALPEERVRFVPLPHYGSVADARAVLRAFRRSVDVFGEEARALDAVWLFGPHPLALAFARRARRLGVRVFLGVRQDLPTQIRSRYGGPKRVPAVAAAELLERAWRRIARTAPTVVVGEDIASRYRRRGAAVHATGFSLIRSSELVGEEEALARPWDDDLRVLSVGRLDPEKNPLLLPEIASLLRAKDPRWRLAIVGDGPLADEVAERVAELNVVDDVELLGYVPNGPRLWEEYRRANAFLHVSFTEGLPQVLFEAQAAGLPVVATDVGGVSAALDGGRTGLLVPPDDSGAAATALERVRDEPELRERLIRVGLENARANTLDAQLDAIAAFFREHLHRK
jgi:glycosyltransferase involved in cell wall biosynthesis